MSFRKIASLAICFSFAFVILFFAPSAHAALLDLHGQAWSSNIGWINFNCADSASGCTNFYKVQYDDTTGDLSGSAWSSSIGWLSFNRISSGATGNPPTPDIGSGSGAIARINISTGKIDGWARFLSNDGTGANKWDGWVKFSSTAGDPATFGATRVGGSITGQVWGSINVGWIKMCDTGVPVPFCVTTDMPPSFNYSLSANDDISIVAGSSGSNTITRTLVAGATQAVTLSVSGLPPGASLGSIASNGCSPTCSGLLTLNSGTAVPGAYLITVTGAPLNRTTTFYLDIMPPSFNYSLSANDDISIVAGSSGSNTITRTLVAGATQAVTLSVSGLPPGASLGSIASNGCSPTCSGLLTLNSGTAVPGAYLITVTGAPLGRTAIFYLDISAATGTGEIKRVDPLFNTLVTPVTNAVFDGGAAQATNPYITGAVPIGNHTFSATNLAGYIITAATCNTAGCTMVLASDYSIMPDCTTIPTLCTTQQTITTGNLRRVAFRYTPISAPSVTLTANPTSV
ncbi:MAG: hypothetical protein AAB482_04080, partial [Patescibacteria group bacterium]